MTSTYNCVVAASMQKLLDEALALPKEERARLLEALADSLDLSPAELSPEWQREISARIAQIEQGHIKTVPWTEIRARVDATLKNE